MASDYSGQRDLEEELRVAQTDVARLTAENAALQTVAEVLIGELTEEQYVRARRRLKRIETGEGEGDESSS